MEEKIEHNFSAMTNLDKEVLDGNSASFSDEELEKLTDPNEKNYSGKIKKSKKENENSILEKNKVYPSAVMLVRHFVLSLKMPGQSAHITMYHPSGKKVYDRELIKHLVDHKAPLVDISKEIL